MVLRVELGFNECSRFEKSLKFLAEDKNVSNVRNEKKVFNILQGDQVWNFRNVYNSFFHILI